MLLGCLNGFEGFFLIVFVDCVSLVIRFFLFVVMMISCEGVNVLNFWVECYDF